MNVNIFVYIDENGAFKSSDFEKSFQCKIPKNINDLTEEKTEVKLYIIVDNENILIDDIKVYFDKNISEKLEGPIDSSVFYVNSMEKEKDGSFTILQYTTKEFLLQLEINELLDEQKDVSE